MTEERKSLYEEYRKLGMSEEQIEAIKEFDDEIEKGDREFYEHTISLDDLEKQKREKQIRRANPWD